MAFFRKNRKKINESEEIKEPKIAPEILKLEIHTMPRKFLGLKPESDRGGLVKHGKDADDKSQLKRPEKNSVKRRILVSIGVVLAVGILMAGVAFFVVRGTEDGNAPEPLAPTIPPAVGRPSTPPSVEPPVVETSPIVPPQASVNAPSQVVFSNIEHESLRVEWIDNSDDERGFRIYRSFELSFESAELISSLAADITSFSLSGLTCDTQYYFWVESFNESAESLSLPGTVSTLECPQSILSNTPVLDEDGDLLSEAEEEIFGTDRLIADSDGDGYLDGMEVLNLFDPRFAQGAEISDSNSIRTFISSEFDYRLLVPVAWEEELINGLDKQIHFITESDEFIEVLVEPNSDGYETALGWYHSEFPTVPVSDLGEVVGQGIVGVGSPGGLASYFVSPDYIYIIIYNQGLNTGFQYLTTYRMIVASFGLFVDPLEGL